jgi:bisphosphoglycerate-independent phosphoglycerate mutase (AlkP superfamily)
MTALAETMINQRASYALPILDLILSKTADKSATAVKTCVDAMKYFGRAAAPYLIKRLDSQNNHVKRAALAALEEISGRKYGYDKKRWNFWRTNLN